jgi:hypothetical protein
LKADDAENETEKEVSKLKGIYWPGMDLFDSATADMKRMRNQKKDGTALQQMKRSSAEIEPTEWIFNADGEFRRARDIFDESTESSPVSHLSLSYMGATVHRGISPSLNTIIPSCTTRVDVGLLTGTR